MNYGLALSLVLAFAPLQAFANGGRALTIDDLDGVREIGGPAISTDGRYVA
jgi:hypothetical protein